MDLSYKQLLNHVTTFIFDVDGVLSDGSVLIFNSGEQVRNMSVRDGFALQLAVKKGYRVCIISGGTSEGVVKRLNLLGIEDVFMGISNKESTFKAYCEKHELDWQEVLYMGDDLPDYNVMKMVGVSTCPNNAAEEIKAISKYVSVKDGGKGCARDVIEQTLKLKGDWFNKDSLDW